MFSPLRGWADELSPPAVDVPGRLRCSLHTIRPSLLASRFREGRLLEPQGGHRPGKCGRQFMAIHIVM